MELLTQDFLKSIAGIDLVLERFSEIEWEAERKLPDTTFKENKNYTIDELKEEKKLFLGIVRKLQAKIEQGNIIHVIILMQVVLCFLHDFRLYVSCII